MIDVILLLVFIYYMKATYQDEILYRMICMLGMNVLTLAILTLTIALIMSMVVLFVYILTYIYYGTLLIRDMLFLIIFNGFRNQIHHQNNAIIPRRTNRISKTIKKKSKNLYYAI
jgi:hypothetical protein